MADGSSRRTRAFVSYSHADAEHLTRLHVHLAPFAREGKMDVWDDTRIKPGTPWQEQIEAAIAQARVAILLISADFLASEFITSNEVPPLLEAAEREGTLIVPVILSPSGFRRSTLARYQAFNNPAEPLIGLPRDKQEALWDRLAEYVADALERVASDGAKAAQPAQVESKQPERKEPARPPFGTLLFNYKHSSSVRSVAWSPNSDRLASRDSNGIVHVWDAIKGEYLLTHGNDSEEVSLLFEVNWSPDGHHLATSGSDKTVRVWDATNGQDWLVYAGHSGPIKTVAWSPDGSRIASGSHDNLQVWDARTGQQLLTHAVQENLLGVAWSPDGKRIASAHHNGRVQIWNAGTGHHLLTYMGHSKPVWAVSWSPDGKRLASASNDKSVQVWDANTVGHLFTCLGHTDTVSNVVWSPNGKRLASASSDGSVRIWDAANGQHIGVYTGHSGWVEALAWSPDGTRIASGGEDTTVQVWLAG